MMHYQFEIVELDAEKFVASQQPGEVIEEYEARIEAAKGKDFFRVAVVDMTDGKMKGLASPLFKREGTERRKALVKAIAELEKLILKREYEKPVIQVG